MSAAGKHTPGPWNINGEIGGRIIVRAADCWPALVPNLNPWGYGRDPEQVANAHLIAAAPDLLAALRLALAAVDRAARDRNDSFLGYALIGDKIRAAIAKAEGR